MRLTPSYDQVAAVLYGFDELALAIGGTSNLRLKELQPKNIRTLGEECGLSPDEILVACQNLGQNLKPATEAIQNAELESENLKQELVTLMNKRWLGTFSNIEKSSRCPPFSYGHAGPSFE